MFLSGQVCHNFVLQPSNLIVQGQLCLFWARDEWGLRDRASWGSGSSWWWFPTNAIFLRLVILLNSKTTQLEKYFLHRFFWAWSEMERLRSRRQKRGIAGLLLLHLVVLIPQNVTESAFLLGSFSFHTSCQIWIYELCESLKELDLTKKYPLQSFPAVQYYDEPVFRLDLSLDVLALQDSSSNWS